MKREKIGITGEYIKLEQLLKLSGLCMTGGEAKTAINDGEVTVNGEVETRRGRKIRPGDVAAFAGVELEAAAAGEDLP